MAFAASVIWEVRTTGNSANGGGFDPVSGIPGIDYSQQDSPQVTYTDLVIDATTNTDCTSAGNPFTSNHVGNIINITSGTGFTVQRVQIMSVTAGVARMDKSLGTLSSTGGNGRLGGAMTTIQGPPVVAGNVVYIKATATYSITASISLTTAGSSGKPILYIGYNSTRGDNGQITILRSSGTGFSCLSTTGGLKRFYNFIVNANSGASTNCFGAGADDYFFNCKALNFTLAGFSLSTRTTLHNCVASGGVAGSTAGFSITSFDAALIECRSTGNNCPGFRDANATANTRSSYIRCIADNNTGNSAYHGFQSVSVGSLTLFNCIAYNNGGNGVLLDTTANAATGNSFFASNCIFASNGVYGINSNTTDYTTTLNSLSIDYNAFYNNASGARNKVSAGSHDVTLTGDPFTNGASNDFSLNNIAGAGASCRAAGFPGVMQSGGTGYIDIGSLQHQDAGGSSSTNIFPIFD